MIRNLFAVVWIVLSTTVLGSLSIAFPPSHNLLMRKWSQMLLQLIGIKVRIYGLQNIKDRNSKVIIMNHESALDIPILTAALPLRIRFMAKKELFRIPLFGWAINLARHIPIDRGNPRKSIAVINRVSDELIRQRYSIVVSPEGTRSYDGKIAPFKKGAFRLAEIHNLPIMPVLILGARHCVPNKRIAINPGIVEVHIGKVVHLKDYPSMNAGITDLRDKMIARKEQYEEKRGQSRID
ncbi:MAG: 1-acyl-sn-glycerol-3-phosphate acyltransferase [Candidatus Marinimicrobia bacterium]|nr:1-acyl-sn-glycerol-3-phosphate acyltransferase [Candidatus Neomarinimicrobiota bacterium]MCK9483209.1 1-acyl-sn-glycerol-3-phosphate acyltransferase [Candidatus Neomarinimicrobiota bacterium]MCK9559213.1 1-acyl-sn-glycerol-3-phosphate acyltransferase [Candidatus Neomarinimicrobiota bacterium]MDD5062050.1 lysophospholipid acyltransferase family protein [Candidatus Neomarinimicrobiota bacterium]